METVIGNLSKLASKEVIYFLDPILFKQDTISILIYKGPLRIVLEEKILDTIEYHFYNKKKTEGY